MNTKKEINKNIPQSKRIHFFINVNGNVAQMVEHFLSMEGAVGSMPTISTFYTQQMDRIHIERKEKNKKRK